MSRGLRARHQRARADVGGEVAQVHAAAGAPQPLGIVDDQRARQAQPPPEVDQRRARAALSLADRVVAQEDDVEAAQGVLLDHRLLGGQRARVVRRAGVVAGAHARRRRQHVVVVQERQIVDGDEADVVAAPVRRQRQVDPGVGRLLIADVGDDEADAHRLRLPTAWRRRMPGDSGRRISDSRSSGSAGATWPAWPRISSAMHSELTIASSVHSTTAS